MDVDGNDGHMVTWVRVIETLQVFSFLSLLAVSGTKKARLYVTLRYNTTCYNNSTGHKRCRTVHHVHPHHHARLFAGACQTNCGHDASEFVKNHVVKNLAIVLTKS